MKISIVIVSLNAGPDLFNTVKSILRQNVSDYEIIIKDGESVDGSIELLPTEEKIRVIKRKDSGIYDAMNQAIEYVSGEYVIFINCGDRLYSETTLSSVFPYLENKNAIYYGDCYTANRDIILQYPDLMDDYTCFTKTLCHQATIYPSGLLKKRGFSLDYSIAADYEYYINAYCQGVALIHIPIVISFYQGNGTSESKKNRVIGMCEAKKVRQINFSRKRYFVTSCKTVLHGVWLKNFLVKQQWFYPTYCRLAHNYYKKKK